MFEAKPSNSFRKKERFCGVSSESRSSSTRTQGEVLRARSKTWRILYSSTPGACGERKLLTYRHGCESVLMSDLTVWVLPLPAGPTNKMPLFHGTSCSSYMNAKRKTVPGHQGSPV